MSKISELLPLKNLLLLLALKSCEMRGLYRLDGRLRVVDPPQLPDVVNQIHEHGGILKHKRVIWLRVPDDVSELLQISFGSHDVGLGDLTLNQKSREVVDEL